MKMRAAIGGTALRTRLAVAGCCALTILGTATISACTGGSPTTSVSTFAQYGSPASGSAGTTSAGSPTDTTSAGSPTDTHSLESPTDTATLESPTDTVTTTPAPAPLPTAAPVTGGGGTAGFQDGLLLVLGLAAIAAGAGSVVYRRRQTRNR
jgi:hypothetical protein